MARRKVHDKRGEFNPDELYDRFPRSAGDDRIGPEFNHWVRINDPRLFTDEAKADPVIRAFLEAPFSVSYAQFKSSYRETEYFIHKPHLAMSGQVEGIDGTVDRLPEEPLIMTMVMNHERTLAKLITRSMTIADDKQAGQMIHKQETEEPPAG